MSFPLVRAPDGKMIATATSTPLVRQGASSKT
jgi:hypothetical protein